MRNHPNRPDLDFNDVFTSDLEERALRQTFDRPRGVAFPVRSALPTFPTIPGLFPRNSFNLLVFTPKIGTWRFLLPQLANYAMGRPFLDIPHPCPDRPEQLGAILCGKETSQVRDGIQSMGLEEELTEARFPMIQWKMAEPTEEKKADDGDFALDRLYEELAEEAGIEPRFLVVDCLYLLLRSKIHIADPVAVAKFARRLHEFCRERHCTVLGTIPAAKTKAGEDYQTLAHRIYGSVQWGVAASSLMLIERYDELSSFRRVRIESGLSRSTHEVRWVDFDLQGRLMLRPAPEQPGRRGGKAEKLEEAVGLGEWGPGDRWTRAEIIAKVREWGEGEGVAISAMTVDRWLARCIEEGLLAKEGQTSRVVYWKARVQ
jgi:hypothetical protein